MKLPAEPQERNDERALWGQVVLAAFMAETETAERDALAECLTNVMHWCDRAGVSFEAQLKRARSLYREERKAIEMRPADKLAS